jgi:hypothetical protein
MANTLSFESLFHAGVQVEHRALLRDMAARGDLAEFARRALLTQLLITHLGDELPEVSDEEVQSYFDRMRGELDYADSDERAEQWLDELGVSAQEGADWIYRHLQIEKYVERFIARSIEQQPMSLIAQMFATMSLRAQVVTTTSVTLLAECAEAPPNGQALESARRHLMSRHGAADWTEIATKLRNCGLTDEQVDAIVATYAKAASVAVK